jgi:outer membrane protein assembly factor BamB
LLLISVTLLSGCSLFSGEEDVVKMAPLPQVENQFTPHSIFLYRRRRPALLRYRNDRPQIRWCPARRDAGCIVKALDAADGKEKWKVDLSEKTGFFSKNRSALLLPGGMQVGVEITDAISHRGAPHFLWRKLIFHLRPPRWEMASVISTPTCIPPGRTPPYLRPIVSVS